LTHYYENHDDDQKPFLRKEKNHAFDRVIENIRVNSAYCFYADCDENIQIYYIVIIKFISVIIMTPTSNIQAAAIIIMTLLLS